MKIHNLTEDRIYINIGKQGDEAPEITIQINSGKLSGDIDLEEFPYMQIRKVR